jgi:hypothetical protein
VKLAFRRHLNGYNHTEILFSDGIWGTSVPGAGVRLSATPFPGEYDFVSVPCDERQEEFARQWFVRHKNAGYDWAARLFGFDRKGRQFCSEAVVLALQAADLLTDLVAHKTHAQALYERAVREFGGGS